ncbi:MAG: histidine phosphatase family protein [Phreatobacter sp.]|uniref:SixA phosphatase family protein n=1 Tax=Phreatobacter sp. TaxID=1966341 RepID=UPI001A6236EF|nr:histidine phosphatase family protein [Phreatobacter sp.]MBL8571054.1 histidine phosphatase family protein [Phreatobacter sp.]
MRRLILLRHTKSDWPNGMVDRDRPLAKRGRRAAPLMGRVLIERDFVPDKVLVSTAQRTVETWALASAGLIRFPPATPEPRIYEAAPHVLANVIRETSDEVRTLLLVGHNPGIEALAYDLIAEGQADLRQRLSRKYPTGGLAVIDCAIDRWTQLARGCGTLVAFVAPCDLDPEAE